MTISTDRVKELREIFAKHVGSSIVTLREQSIGVVAVFDELLAMREAQSVPVFEIEVSGAHWLNCSPGLLTPSDDADFSDWPDGVNKLYAAQRVPAVPNQQLINIANHIAGSADGLPVEWKDWASELVSDLRQLAASNPAPAVPGDVEFNAWISADENRAETMKCPISLGTARSAWFGCCAAMLQLSGDAEQVPALQAERVIVCDMCGHDAFQQGSNTYKCDNNHVFHIRREHVSEPYKLPVVRQSDHLKRAISLAAEAKELADRVRAEEQAPSTPVVPAIIPHSVYKVIYDECGGFVECTANAQAIWDACRAALLPSDPKTD